MLLLGTACFKRLVAEWAREHNGEPVVQPPPDLAQACFLEGFLPAFTDGLRRTGKHKDRSCLSPLPNQKGFKTRYKPAYQHSFYIILRHLPEPYRTSQQA